jgi:hypothetical protein
VVDDFDRSNNTFTVSCPTAASSALARPGQ